MKNTILSYNFNQRYFGLNYTDYLIILFQKNDK